MRSQFTTTGILTDVYTGTIPSGSVVRIESINLDEAVPTAIISRLDMTGDDYIPTADQRRVTLAALMAVVPETAPAQVLGLTATAGSPLKATLAWTAIANATYDIEAATDAGFATIVKRQAADTNAAVVTGLTAVAHWFRVRAIVGGNRGPVSASATCTPLA